MSKANFKRFIICLDNKPDVKADVEAVKRHIGFLRKLAKDNVLDMCGPFSDYGGGMIILKNVGSKEEAEEIARMDPFVQEELKTLEIRTWALSCEENNHLGMG